MKYSIEHLLHIESSSQEVFKAISSIEGLSNWWTVQTKGTTGIGGLIQFDFGDFKGPLMRVIEQQENKRMVWECVDQGNGWLGHHFTFVLDENQEKIRLRFSHSGWEENDDFYAGCSFSWGRYLESLRQYCQTGIGQAFGSSGYT